MGSALDEFRAQREVVLELQVRLSEVADLVRSVREQTTKLAQDDGLRKLLQEEQAWLRSAEDLIREGQYARLRELERFWPGVWRRWAIAMVIAITIAFAAGAGHVWAGASYRSEIATLQARVDALDFVARRFLTVSPAERKQFDALLKPGEARRQ